MSGIVMLSGDDARDELINVCADGDLHELASSSKGSWNIRLLKADYPDHTNYIVTDDRGDFSLTSYPESMVAFAHQAYSVLAG